MSTRASAIHCVGALAACLTALQPPAVGQVPEEGQTMDGEHAMFTYGFRYDPMQFVANDQGVQGALVRTVALGQPQPGDRAILDKRVEEILAEQQADGSFSGDPNHNPRSLANGKLNELLQLGAAPARPEMQRLLGWIHALPPAQPEGPDDVDVMAARLHFTRGLSLLGEGERPEVREALRWLADHPEVWIGGG